MPLPGIRRDSGADEKPSTRFWPGKQGRQIASLRRALTLGLRGLKAAADKAKKSRSELLVGARPAASARSSRTLIRPHHGYYYPGS